MNPNVSSITSAEQAGQAALDSLRTVSADTTAAAATTEQPAPFDEQEIRAALAHTADQVVIGGHQISFSYNGDLHRVVVTVRSKETGEVIRTIPPEEYMRFAARMRELMGVLLEKKS